MPLGCTPPGLQKCSIGKKDVDTASLRVRDINGAAGVHSDPRRAVQTRVFKGLQRSAARFKFVDEAGDRVGKENVAQRISREGDRRVEFAGAVALISPSAEELKRWRRLRLRRRIHSIAARNEKKYGYQRGLRKSPSHRIGICIRHAPNLHSEVA